MKKIVVTSLSLVMLSSNVVYADVKIVKTPEEGYSVKACEPGMQKGKIANFRIGNMNSIAQAEIIKDGCATKTYSKGVVKPGDKVIVSFNDEAKIVEAFIPNAGTTNPPPGSSSSTSIEGLKTMVIAKGPDLVEFRGCHDNLVLRDQVIVTDRSTLGTNKFTAKSTEVVMIDGKKCFSVNFKKGEVENGDVIGIGAYQTEKAVTVTLKDIPWKRSGSTTTPPSPQQPPQTGNPGGPTQPQQPVDNRKVEDNASIVKTAGQAARAFANQVARNLGHIESIRYNLFLGFRQAERIAQDFGARFEHMSEYRMGFEEGVYSSRSDRQGFIAGQSAANQTTYSLAQAEVNAAVDQAMAGGSFDPQPSGEISTSFAGVSPQLPLPKSIETRMREKDLRLTLRQQTRFEDGVILAEDVLNGYYSVGEIYSLRDYKYDYILSSYRAEKAFQAWLDNVFRADSALQTYYAKITNSEVYKYAPENGRVFVEAFLSEYDEEIPGKWNAAVMKSMPEIQKLGADTYMELARQYALDLGHFDGYSSTYEAQSREGFRQNLGPSYYQNFQQAVGQVKNSSSISGVTLQAVTAGGQSVTLGDAIGLVIVSGVNRGMKAGQIVVQTQSNEQVGVLKPAVAVDLAPFSKLSPTNMGAVAYVSRLSSPDQSLTFQVASNQGTYTLAVKADLETLLRRLAAASTSSQTKGALLGHLAKFLSAEFASKKTSFGNGFNDGRGTLLLERMVATYRTMSSSEQQALRAFGVDIKRAYGDKPGMLSPYKDDYASAMALLASMDIK